MTTQTSKNLTFNVTKHGWRDAFVVAFLAIVLGAFVAQISSTPKHSPARMPIATATLNVASNG